MRLSHFPMLSKGEKKVSTENLIYIIKCTQPHSPALNTFPHIWLLENLLEWSFLLRWKISCKHDTIISRVTSRTSCESGGRGEPRCTLWETRERLKGEHNYYGVLLCSDIGLLITRNRQSFPQQLPTVEFLIKKRWQVLFIPLCFMHFFVW